MIHKSSSVFLCFLGSETTTGGETAAGRDQPSERTKTQAGEICGEGISRPGWIGAARAWNKFQKYKKRPHVCMHVCTYMVRCSLHLEIRELVRVGFLPSSCGF